MRKRKYNLPAHVCWDVTSNNYHVSITVNGKRYSNKYNTVKEAMEKVVEVLYKKTGKWNASKAKAYLEKYPIYKHLDDKGGYTVDDSAISNITLIEVLKAIEENEDHIPQMSFGWDSSLNCWNLRISDRYTGFNIFIHGNSIQFDVSEYVSGTYNTFSFKKRLVYTKDEFCTLVKSLQDSWKKDPKINSWIDPQSVKYTGHDTTKYNTICVKDRFILEGKKHSLLVNSLHKAQYILREDGEVFSYNPETGDMKHKVQYFSESGGVKNRARREAGKGGGSVYKTVGLWNYQFLTHKLVAKYIAEAANTTGKKERVSPSFYKGIMPNTFGKRCYKAN